MLVAADCVARHFECITVVMQRQAMQLSVLLSVLLLLLLPLLSSASSSGIGSATLSASTLRRPSVHIEAAAAESAAFHSSRQPSASVAAHAWEQSYLYSQASLGGQYTEKQQREAKAAAKAAHAYAADYVAQMHATPQTLQRTRPASKQQQKQQQQQQQRQNADSKSGAPKKFSASTYALLEKAQAVTRAARARKTAAASVASNSADASSAPFRFADSGASFVEEGVRMSSRSRSRLNSRSREPFEKQEWTYSDGSSPSWLVPDPEAKQGCPTTKPPPVPRMPPPPPPVPTPTWMSPFSEHMTPEVSGARGNKNKRKQ